ncbi:MAG TPA: hypothetical protein VFE47_22630 [Tepidisphaeraceae bacterium]|jgi:hypothetical protein|nr:hypothetical protein [Tepidisphaeraceae bacterium]
MTQFHIRRAFRASILSLAFTGLLAPAVFAKHEPKADNGAAISEQYIEAVQAKKQADKAFDDITNKLLAGLDHNSTYAAAQKDADAAQTAFDAMNESALTSLRNQPTYKAELAARDAAKADLERARTTGQASDEEKTTLALAVMRHNTAIHKMEASASKTVPGFAAARSKAMSAQARLAQVKAGYMKQVSQDPQWVAAKTAMEQSHAKLSEAEVALSKIPDHTRGPIAANPIAANPRNIQPVVAQPVVAQPRDAQPISKDPVAANPVSKDPVNAQPVNIQPKNAQPVAKDPVNAQPVAKDPVNAQPVNAQPVTKNPIPGGPPNN